MTLLVLCYEANNVTIHDYAFLLHYLHLVGVASSFVLEYPYTKDPWLSSLLARFWGSLKTLTGMLVLFLYVASLVCLGINKYLIKFCCFVITLM